MNRFQTSLVLLCVAACQTIAADPKTHVSIVGESFHLNGKPTYEGRKWKGTRIEGLLFNARMVQATFDDLNPETRNQWSYPDSKVWDADRNLDEFIAAMPNWRQHGLLAFTVNLQGGSPQGYSRTQPWSNPGFTESGEMIPEYAARMEKVILAADDLGMVVILGYFYFGQDQRLRDESAILAATDNATRWVLQKDFRNVVIEVNNECDVPAYDHAILKADRVHELIERVKAIEISGHRLLVGTSYGGGAVPGEKVVRVSDFLLLHGNGIQDSQKIAEQIQRTKKVPGFRPMPILYNEDDHFEFDKPTNNFLTAVASDASWGYFDYRMPGEGFDEGFQSVPVNWNISSQRKRGFFRLLSEITGETP